MTQDLAYSEYLCQIEAGMDMWVTKPSDCGALYKNLQFDGVDQSGSLICFNTFCVVGHMLMMNASIQIWSVLCVWIANELREDYQFVHTFEMSAARQKYSGVNAGSLVIFLSERFQTKYEDKSQVLQIKVWYYMILHLTFWLWFDSHYKSFESNFEQVANFLCSQVYSASFH